MTNEIEELKKQMLEQQKKIDLLLEIELRRAQREEKELPKKDAEVEISTEKREQVKLQAEKLEQDLKSRPVGELIIFALRKNLIRTGNLKDED